MKVIYTIGTSSREIIEFIDLLNAHNIELVIDVRRFPTSKFTHFNKEFLQSALEKKGIKYIHLGYLLGGYRKNGYRAYMETENFNKGIEKIKELSIYNTCAIMCAEKFPWKCHRRFISMKLEEYGCKVIHIIEKNKVWITKT